jgi:hypothetical protein
VFGADIRHYSPIKVLGLRCRQDGSRRMELSFYHAAYPEGVRDKTYLLETIERGGNFMMSRSVDHEPVRLLQVYEVSADWIRRHFAFPRPPSSEEDVQLWLDLHA